eukprot:gb/GECG01012327.1/.p1 GENE.gb/GECG01012327.1/~~gb/GECG01012327.1/.p1  ORF type:complete len:186 (+),score=13.64 gb/GECG01012327.1/:1-558(+)
MLTTVGVRVMIGISTYLHASVLSNGNSLSPSYSGMSTSSTNYFKKRASWFRLLVLKLITSSMEGFSLVRAQTINMRSPKYLRYVRLPGEDEEEQTNVQQCVARGAWRGGLPWILRHTDKLADIPMAIVHGRQDIVCRPRAAYELHKRCPNSTLVYVHDAGHGDSEPGTSSQLIKATEKMKTAANS